MATDTARPIIIVTGANGGVGYGICERLLHQLCHATPSDSLPQSFVTSLPSSSSHESPGYPGLTLIMACRNAKRANAAREKLIRSLDSYVKRLKKAEGYDGYAEKFRENVEIDVVGVELAMIGTVFKAAEEIKTKYPYISHIICNAGVAPFASIDWVACIKQLCISPMAAITSPTFYLQTSGERSMDGLGWVWQCNLFAHYVLFRELQPLLSCTPSSLTPRVIWMSSLEANPEFYDPEDWQSTNTLHPYEGTKYGIDILSLALDYHAQKVEYGLEKSGRKGAEGANITRHFVTQPGICSTNVSAAIAGPTLDIFKVLLFYLGRLFGSPHHTISPYKAAIGAVHLALASLSFISLLPRASSTQDEKPPILRRPLKYGAETGRWGEERVGIAPIKEWEDNKERAEDLLEKCERLYEQVKGEREPGVDSGSE